jgi:uridine kinase
MDDLYNGWQNAFDHHLTDALLGAAIAHRSSKPYSLSRYLWNQSQYSEAQAVKEADLLILEGVGSSQRIIRPQLTATIWIDIDEAAGLERVLRRDGDAISTQMREWLGTQAQHFALEESKDAADFVLTT